MKTNTAFSKFNLEKKTALITGASGLLGQEHAYALLESGARVILTDISKEKLEQAKSRLAKFFKANKIIIKLYN